MNRRLQGQQQGIEACALVLVVSSLASIACFSATAAYAQREDDNFSHTVRYDAHASCNSKVLVNQGFSIAGVVPGTDGKECYWKRTAATNPPPDATKQPSTQSAIAEARSRRDATLQEIEQARAADWPIFWKHFNACAGESVCESEMIRGRIAIEQDLDAASARANTRFQHAMQQILSTQIRPDTQP